MQTIVTHRPLSSAPSLWSWLRHRLFPAPARPAGRAQWLAKGGIARVSVPAAATLNCENGSVWITADDGGPDIVLEAGGSTHFSRRTAVLVEALQESRITLRG